MAAITICSDFVYCYCIYCICYYFVIIFVICCDDQWSLMLLLQKECTLPRAQMISIFFFSNQVSFSFFNLQFRSLSDSNGAMLQGIWEFSPPTREAVSWECVRDRQNIWTTTCLEIYSPFIRVDSLERAVKLESVNTLSSEFCTAVLSSKIVVVIV